MKVITLYVQLAIKLDILSRNIISFKSSSPFKALIRHIFGIVLHTTNRNIITSLPSHYSHIIFSLYSDK